MVKLSAIPTNAHKISITLILSKGGQQGTIANRKIQIEDLPEDAEIEYYETLSALLIETFNKNLGELEKTARAKAKELKTMSDKTK